MKLPNIKQFLMLSCLVIGFAFLYLVSKQEVREEKGFDAKVELASIKNSSKDVYQAIYYKIKNIVEQEGIGGAVALSELAVKNGDVSFNQCHNLLHLIGHLAYAHEKDEFAKLATYKSELCIDSLQHGIEAEIVLANPNQEGITKLKTYCSQVNKIIRGINCYHGAGHAYMSVIKSPFLAVKNCDHLNDHTQRETDNCYRGVFSEYASEALGVDSDTGLALSGPPPVILDFDKPFDFCNTFEEKYRKSCYSQLAKVLFVNNPGYDGALQACLDQNGELVQNTCVNVIAGITSRSELSVSSLPSLPAIYRNFPEVTKESFLKGVKETFIGYENSGISKNWPGFCQLLSKEAEIEKCKNITTNDT